MIDIYCERVEPSLWAEPVNALTNLAFILAAIIVGLQAKKRGVLKPNILLLIGLMAVIGIGSMFFHTYATKWARVLDILPILLFQVAFLWVYGRVMIDLSPKQLLGAVIVFFILAYIFRGFPDLLNGSLIYLPALTLLLILGSYHYLHADNERSLLLVAVAVFSFSLFFRSIDMAVCDYFPLGTHFLWHLSNGLLVYLVVRSLVVNIGDYKQIA